MNSGTWRKLSPTQNLRKKYFEVYADEIKSEHHSALALDDLRSGVNFVENVSRSKKGTLPFIDMGERQRTKKGSVPFLPQDSLSLPIEVYLHCSS